jgi:hypothetical protein
MDLLRRFAEAAHRGREYRPTTLWSWNDRLEPDDVRRQIREMARGGLGGHVMHARRGLPEAYLGPQWMEAVRHAIDEGAHTGVTPWLYDEDTSPSGSCSGRVYAGRDAFRQKYLVVEPITNRTWEPSECTVAVFVGKKKGKDEYASFRRVPQPRAVCGRTPGRDETFLHFVYRVGEHADVFSREATQAFLKQTHERYQETVGGEFGRAIPGILTDDPQYAGAGHRVPWSPHLLRYFQRTCHYDLVDHLPELFYPVGDYRKTRFDFYETVTRLFLLAWTMPIYQWCDRNGLRLSGHLAGEETLLDQVQCIGAALPHYEYMHVPGIDVLGRSSPSPVAVKQAASAAAQAGRERVLSESFAGAGWALTLDEMRFLAEWQFALGVNLVCTHQASFSLRGVRKRDFPPSLHYHQPWWPYYHLWNEYMAALAAVLTAGEPVVDVLVLHPIASAWAEYSPIDEGTIADLDQGLARLVEFLLGIHVDFHFGDELVLERQASVSKGTLVVGNHRYGTVVVPDATNLRRNTVTLLKRLKKSGGAILFAGRVPEYVDGEPSDAPAGLAKGCKRADVGTARGRGALRRALKPDLEVLRAKDKDATSVVAQWRRVGEDHLFFFVNTDRERQVRARLRVPVAGTPLVLDPSTGEYRPVTARGRKQGMTLSHTFPPRASLLLLVRPPDAPEGLVSGPTKPPSRRHVLKGRWRIRRLDPNVLVLDTARWRTDDEPYSDPMPVVDIQQELMRRDRQQPVTLRFEFACGVSDLSGRRFALVVEDPASHELWYNEMRTPLNDAGPYWDAAFRRTDVTRYVRGGPNVIELRRPWQLDPRRRGLLTGRAGGWALRTVAPDTELEAVYLIGDFAVDFPDGTRQGDGDSRWMLGRPRLVDEPDRLTGTDLVRAGYPFFTGRLVLEREVTLPHAPREGAVLDLPSFKAVTATVVVNGHEAGTVWQCPAQVSLDGLLEKGRNHVGVILTTGLRNLLGPHHHADGELAWVTPQAYACRHGWLGRAPSHGCEPEAYNVVNFGLDAEPVLRY